MISYRLVVHETEFFSRKGTADDRYHRDPARDVLQLKKNYEMELDEYG